MTDTLAGFNYVEHPVFIPDVAGGVEPQRRPVLIAGGGPVGLATAIGLARQGIASLVIEADTTVCVGSRAICLSRRTFEILDRLSALEPFLEKGLAWTGGRSFYHDELVLKFEMAHDDDQRLAPMTNIQQYYVEQYLLDAAQDYPELIEIRWGTQVADVVQVADGVTIDLRCGDRTYQAKADYVVACDGARSQVRQSLGLRMSGTSYEGRYVIVDIELDADLPTERIAWFNPPSNPGRTMLMHRQPDNVWRLDYQLSPDEDPDEMLREERITPVVEAHLAMMGIAKPWKLIWKSMYRAAAVSLDSYRKGRVMFAGDAAHLVPIFGVRGLNSGFDDAFNLAWKLGYVLRGLAPDALLDSYSRERRAAWDFNVTNAMKSTEFMAPPSRGFELMRDAVLSLARENPGLGSLINPRQSSVIVYENSSLNTATPDDTTFQCGPPLGAPLLECPLAAADGRTVFLTALMADGFNLIFIAADEEFPGSLVAECEAVSTRIPLSICIIRDKATVGGAPTNDARIEVTDAKGRFAALFDARAGTALLVRPDGHICARWRHLAKGDVTSAIAAAVADDVSKELH
jgi:3-(3-hydroxy-phenyl)propionate hydroxylase